MPVNIPIEGGQPLREPEGWDAEKHGPCGTLQVLVDDSDPSLPRLVSAYRITPAEDVALAEGGCLFLSIAGGAHPPVSLWIQDGAGEVVGDGLSIGDSETIAKAAVAWEEAGGLVDIGFDAMMAELDAQAEQRTNQPEIGEPDAIGQVPLKGVFSLKAALSVALEAIGGHLALQRAEGRKAAAAVAHLPVMDLGAVAAEAQASQAIGKAMEQLESDFMVGSVPGYVERMESAVQRFNQVQAEGWQEHFVAGDGWDGPLQEMPQSDARSMCDSAILHNVAAGGNYQAFAAAEPIAKITGIDGGEIRFRWTAEGREFLGLDLASGPDLTGRVVRRATEDLLEPGTYTLESRKCCGFATVQPIIHPVGHWRQELDASDPERPSVVTTWQPGPLPEAGTTWPAPGVYSAEHAAELERRMEIRLERERRMANHEED